MKKYLLLVAKGFLPDAGGVERYSAELALAYASAGYRVLVLTQCSVPNPISRSKGVIVINIPAKYSQIAVFLRMAMLCRLILSRYDIDIIHSTTWKVAIPVILFRRRPKLVVTIHGREIFVVPRILRGLLRYTLQSADLVAFVSSTIQKMQQRLLNLNLKRQIVCWNGVSFGGEMLEKRKPGRKLNILSFNRLVERKNMLKAVESIYKLRQRGLEINRYLIAGNGPEFNNIKRRITELKLDDVVHMLGRVDDAIIPQLYREADVFLHPQIASEGGLDVEGFGLTIADSMVYGCTVVAGKAGGPSDFIVHGDNGMLVDGENVDEICGALMMLANDEKLLCSIGTRGQFWVKENLDWTRLVNQVLSNVDANEKNSS